MTRLLCTWLVVMRTVIGLAMSTLPHGPQRRLLRDITRCDPDPLLWRRALTKVEQFSIDLECSQQ
jgi:hypothetical protein